MERLFWSPFFLLALVNCAPFNLNEELSVIRVDAVQNTSKYNFILVSYQLLTFIF